MSHPTIIERERVADTVLQIPCVLDLHMHFQAFMAGVQEAGE